MEVTITCSSLVNTKMDVNSYSQEEVDPSEMGDRVTHKDTIQIWHRAIQDLEDGDVDASLENFEDIVETSAKMNFNIGALWLRKRNYTKAASHFIACTERDQHMAVAHFALGLTYFYMKQYNKSRQSYEKCQKCLRGNIKIDYTQLGLKFVLWECDIIYDLALTLATMMNEYDWPVELLEDCLKGMKEENQKERLSHAIRSLQSNILYEPVELPNEVFKPPQGKVNNLRNVNYLGEKKVITTLSVKHKPEEKPSGPTTAVNSADFSPSEWKDKRPHPPPPSLPPSLPPSVPPPPSNSSHVFHPIKNGDDGVKTSHKDNLVMWHEGVLAFESGRVNDALDEWLKIHDPSAKILFNIAIAQIDQNDIDGAKKTCHGVINKDEHLAIGHFLLGEVQCKKRHFDDAWKSFDKALTLLRGKDQIDYSQLGLTHKLFKCEILCNQAFCYFHSGMDKYTTQLLSEAQSSKMETKHSYIDKALEKALVGQSFDYISVPSNAIFKPPKSKIDNLARQSFLGTAKVVSQLKGTENKLPAVNVPPRGTTPPRVPSPSPPMRAPPPVPAPSYATKTSNTLQPPVASKERSGRASPGPPNRPPPVLATSRSKSPNITKGVPLRKVPPPPKKHSSDGSLGSSFDPDQPLPAPPAGESLSNSANASPVVKRKGPPNKALPPPPVGKTSAHSSRSSSAGSSPRSISPNLDERKRGSGGPPMKPLPPSPLSLSPRSGSPVRSVQDKLFRPVASHPTTFSMTKTDATKGKVGRPPSTLRKTAIVKVSYEAKKNDELTVSEGDIVKILSQDGDWTKGDLKGEQGLFPSSCL